MINLPFTLVDYLALVWFIVGWLGYQIFAIWAARRGWPCLMSVMGQYRQDWWHGLIMRELRMVDANILTNLSNSATFFASTTVLILGALLALLGTSDDAMSIISDLPFATETQRVMWEYKIFLLVAIFVYAFFKFTWSLRQHNFCSVLVGAAPDPHVDPERLDKFVALSATLASAASNTFNYGLRAYYFALAALTWFLNPWAFIFVTTMVVVVLYHREFHSETLHVMHQSSQ
jgi:uncharacterized membrane protein